MITYRDLVEKSMDDLMKELGVKIPKPNKKKASKQKTIVILKKGKKAVDKKKFVICKDTDDGFKKQSELNAKLSKSEIKDGYSYILTRTDEKGKYTGN